MSANDLPAVEASAERVPETRSILARYDAAGSTPVFALFQQALEKGAEGAQAMETLYKVYSDERAHAARMSFNRAFAKFQAECPAIERDKVVDFTTKTGVRVAYKSVSLENIINTTRPVLIANGFSVTFDSVTGAVHTETGTLHHEDGHSISSSVTMPTANNNPGMSDQQKYAGASTFAQRRCLIALLALAITDPDPDGDSSEEAHTPITEAQAADLRALIDETKADLPRFLKWIGAASLPEIPARDFTKAVTMLQEKRKQGAK